jgi:hypothetical protein
MTETKSNYGGARLGAGRPAKKPDDQTQVVSIRLAKYQHAAVLENGGVAWVRSLIDKAIAESSQTPQNSAKWTVGPN